MNIDQFKPALVYTIYFAAKAERVWRHTKGVVLAKARDP